MLVLFNLFLLSQSSPPERFTFNNTTAFKVVEGKPSEHLHLLFICFILGAAQTALGLFSGALKKDCIQFTKQGSAYQDERKTSMHCQNFPSGPKTSI